MLCYTSNRASMAMYAAQDSRMKHVTSPTHQTSLVRRNAKSIIISSNVDAHGICAHMCWPHRFSCVCLADSSLLMCCHADHKRTHTHRDARTRTHHALNGRYDRYGLSVSQWQLALYLSFSISFVVIVVAIGIKTKAIPSPCGGKKESDETSLSEYVATGHPFVARRRYTHTHTHTHTHGLYLATLLH
jgi:hypothetical protein